MYLEPASVLGRLARHLPRGLDVGPLTEELEGRFAALTGAAHCCATAHARTAFKLLLDGLALPAGGRVLMTPITIPDIVNVVLNAGLVPCFVDLAPRTCNIDIEAARAMLERDEGIVLALITHLCGFPTDMDRLVPALERAGVPLLEDCSQVPGALYKGRALGRHGVAGVYSLTTLKPIHTIDGALVITDDAAVARRFAEDSRSLPAKSRRELTSALFRDAVFYASSQRQVFTWGTYYAARVLERVDPVGTRAIQRGNLPLTAFQAALRREPLPDRFFRQYTDLQAGIGLDVLDRFDGETAHRVALAERLLQRLTAADVPGLPVVADEARPIWWRFPLWVDEPDGLRDFLTRRYVDSATSGLLCMSREEDFGDLATDTPEAFRFMDGMVFLPIHSNLTEADIDYVADGVVDWYAQRGQRAARSYLVVGAAGGVGSELVRRLGRQGAAVTAADLDAGAMADQFAPSDQLALCELDVRSPDDWQRVVAEHAERFSGLDVLINCAGIVRGGPILDVPPRELLNQLDTNAGGVLVGTAVAAAAMRSSGGGHIINFGSMSGRMPTPHFAAYAGSKYAVRGFSLSAAPELAAQGVDVTVVSPGAIDTPMLAAARRTYDGSPMRSSAAPLSAADVADVVLSDRVLTGRPLEVHIPAMKGLAATLIDAAPGVASRLLAGLGRGA